MRARLIAFTPGRWSLARADAITSFSLLILDEATSALDAATEKEVMASLRAIPGLTLVVIAHRASTLDHCDLHIRLEGGRIST